MLPPIPLPPTPAVLPAVRRPEVADAVAIDPAARDGVWEGWGTSLCWMGKAFGERDDVADLLFTRRDVTIGSERLPGLGLNVVRYNAGACSWNEVDGRRMVVGRTIQPFRQMEGFWLDGKSADPDSSSWDWSVDRAQREMMLRARRRGANRFELFSNAPMWWMCRNDNPSGAADPNEDNLRPERADDFARYLAAIARRAKDRWGVAFTTVSPFNEPASGWWNADGKQEGCHFSAATQADLLPRLRRELDRRGLRDLPIAASDETYVSQALATWRAWSPEIRALVPQVNVHGYEGERSPRAALYAATRDRTRWLSEHGEEDGSGLALARRLHLDLAEFHPSAWSYWQPLDGGGWGLLRADLPNRRILGANPKHFVLAQYTRHVRPGATLLATGDPATIAALDPVRRRLTLVALAASGSGSSTRTFDLARVRRGAGPIVRWTTEPRAFARYRRSVEPAPVGGRLTVALAPDSVQTFEIPLDGAATKPR